MDNPSSVITQVSRDEEGSKAAADRGGESPLGSRVGAGVGGEKVVQLRQVDNRKHTSMLRSHCGQVSPLGSPVEFERRVCQCFCAAWIVNGLSPCGPVMKVAEVTSQFCILLVKKKSGTIWVVFLFCYFVLLLTISAAFLFMVTVFYLKLVI